MNDSLDQNGNYLEKKPNKKAENSDVEKCRMCKSDLLPKARKCSVCGSYQRFWERLLSVGATVLGIGSLGTIAVGAVGLITGHEPNIVGTVAKLENSTAHLSISNQGGRAATLVGVQIHQTFHNEKCEKYDSALELQGDSVRQVLIPGETRIVTGSAPSGSTLPITFIPEVLSGERPVNNSEDFNNCRAVLIYIDHKNNYKKSVINFMCISANEKCSK